MRLIEIQKNSIAFDNTLCWFCILFIAIIALIIFFSEPVIGLIFAVLLIIPSAAIVYNKLELERLTAHFRADLNERKKYHTTQRIEMLDTRTDAWTVQSELNQYKTIYKSFDYFIKAGDYIFVTKEEGLYKSLQEGDIVDLEVAKNSNYVLSLRKT